MVHRAEIHGEELVGIVLQNFQKQAFIQHLTPDGYALICKLSLDALKILCNREVSYVEEGKCTYCMYYTCWYICMYVCLSFPM